MTKLKAIIIDDSPQARKLLFMMLEEHSGNLEVIAEAEQAEQGLELIKQHQPDVIFLDIEMPGKSGIQLAEQLLIEKINPAIVFTTAYNDYALKAFRLSAIDYLLKPINETHLQEALEKIKKLHPQAEEEKKLKTFIENYGDSVPKTISIPSASGYIFLKTDDILYIKADGSYTHIYTSNEKPITVSKNLKYFENVLDGYSHFIRVHRSYLINLQQMKKFDKQNRGEIIMNNETIIDLARDRREEFFKTLEKHML
jgi:two-component system, LytTR family, response regulator